MTPLQLDERVEAEIERKKDFFQLMQLAVSAGMAGDPIDPDELYKRQPIDEPEWKSEIAKIDAILPDDHKDV